VASILRAVKTAVLKVYPAAKSACINIIHVKKPKYQNTEPVIVADISKTKSQKQPAAVAPSVGRRPEQLPSREGTFWCCTTI